MISYNSLITSFFAIVFLAACSTCDQFIDTPPLFNSIYSALLLTDQGSGTAFPVANIHRNADGNIMTLPEVKKYLLDPKKEGNIEEGQKEGPLTIWATAAHVVVHTSPEIIINIYKGGHLIDVVLGRVIKIHEKYDLALIEASGHYKTLAISHDDPVVGDEVFSFGAPLGLSVLLEHGYVSGFNKGDYIVSAPCAPGSSGGPVFDYRSQKIIGITKAVMVYGKSRQVLSFMHLTTPGKYLSDWLKKEGLL